MRKEELVATLMKHMSRSMTYLVIQGHRRPSYKKMMLLVQEGIPFVAWLDFTGWVEKNVV